MIVIAVINIKGGTGKTTVAYSLSVYWDKRGSRVLIVDTDPQGTFAAFYIKRQDKGQIEGSGVALSQLERHVKRNHGHFDYIVIDTPGYPRELQSAIEIADVIVIPVQPSDADYHGAMQTLETIRQYSCQEKVILVPNRIKSQSEGDSAKRILTSISYGSGRIANPIVDSVLFKRDSLSGLSIIDKTKPGSATYDAIASLATMIEGK